MQRLDVLEEVAAVTTAEDLFVSSVGALLDDWWNLRPGRTDNTFSPSILGSVSTTALGLALALPHRRVVALETDGSVLMNTGAMATIGNVRPGNLTVVVLDNGIYECIGGPPTLTSGTTDLEVMARGAGCTNTVTVRDRDVFGKEFREQVSDGELGYVVTKIAPGVHDWPDEDKRWTDGVEDKYRFLRYVERLEGITIHHRAPQV
jgi:thiamine pyrophosphate-dependent acetolactate synthase large subunit-like protein